MFGISFLELVVILTVALLVFGPEKMPDIARKIGKLSADLRRASDGVRREFYNAMYTPAKEDLERAQRELKTLREKMDEFKPHPLCPDTIAKQQAAALPPGEVAALTPAESQLAAGASPTQPMPESNQQAAPASVSDAPKLPERSDESR